MPLHRTPRTPAAAIPRSLMPAVNEARRTIAAQQDAITQLQASLAGLQAHGAAQPPPRAPPASTPEKCELEMPPATLRSWRRSVECWLLLCKWPQHDAVHHIRLLCVPALQRAMDARFSVNEWAAMTPEEALDAISRLVSRPATQALQWSDFFNAVQRRGENVSEYFIRCAQLVNDCAFECPQCSMDLSESMLLKRLVSGLSDIALKQRVYELCDSITSVDALRELCCAHEAAHRAATRDASEGAAACTAGSAPIEEGVTHDATATIPTTPATQAAAAATANRPRPTRPCGNCGLSHAPGRAACPAAEATCLSCKKLGHFKRCCRSTKRTAARVREYPLSSAVASAGGRGPGHPTVEVVTSHGGTSSPVVAVADTGAQVCVAGPSLLSSLHIRPATLRRATSLRDVANLPLKCLGSAECSITLGNHTTRQDIYFLQSAGCLFLSLEACRALWLVPENFPHHLPAAAPTLAAVEAGHGPHELPPRPASPPFPLLEEHAGQLERWLLHHFSSTTFNTARSPLPVMEGKPHRIHLAPGATPHACHTPAPVPRHWEDAVKAQLDEDVRRGVIEPVPAGEPTEWCARMVVVAKKSGQPRRTVDYQRLNASCQRETHHTPAPFDMVSAVPKHSLKTVADAYWGYHQVELDQESRRLTTFITPWGRFKYRRTPMGHCSAGDAYTKRFDDAIQGIPRKYKCVDDTLLFDSSVEAAFWHTYDFLATCAAKGITLKPEKFQFARREVDFVGFRLGWDDYKPTSERLAAIRSFQMPDKPSVTDIRSWYGFVNQLAPFLATAPIMNSFRELLKKPTGKHVYWDEQLREKFHQAQDTICQLAKDGLVYYDRSRPTAAVTDWSRDGIGFVILQQYCECSSAAAPYCCKGGWRLALCGSRHLTPAEAGYAAVEGEALAVVWCLKKARLFLLGCPNLTIVTDHRPLVKLLGDRALTEVVNPRLFRLKEQTLQFHFQVRYLPGKRNTAADFLSRYPALKTSPSEADLSLEEDIDGAVAAAITAGIGHEGRVVDEAEVRQAAAEDTVYQMLLTKVLEDDWHQHKAQEVACLRPFYGVRDRLAVTQDLITYTFEQGCVRLVVPEALRRQVAENLHAGHQGLDSMLRRARQCVYWPGMEGDLQQQRRACGECETHAPSQPVETLIIASPPEYPFQQTVVDMFQQEGQMYMVYADRLTGWLELAHFPQITSSQRIKAQLRSYFARWGAPEQVSTDGGTNLTSDEMAEFFGMWGVSVRLSSAQYPQSNGRAEAAVKTAKRLIMANTGPGGTLDSNSMALATLQYLNTPLRGVNKSPAQLATGRQLRDGVPTGRWHLMVDRQWGRTLRRREVQMGEDRDSRVSRSTPRNLPPLTPGAQVRVQNQATNLWDRTGLVVEAKPYRQYTVRLYGSGRLTLRNRKHLRPCNSSRPREEVEQARDNQDELTVTPQPRTSRRESRRPQWLDDYV